MTNVKDDGRGRRGGAVVALGCLGVLATVGTALGTTSTAFADTVTTTTSLSLVPPAAVGFAGGPVPFDEEIGNWGPTAESVDLDVLALTPPASTPPNAVTLDYRDPATGNWRALTDADGHPAGTWGGTVPSLTLQPYSQVKVSLRLAAPMGTPHHGDTNGGLTGVGLDSKVTRAGDPTAVLAHYDRTVPVESIRSAVGHVPASAVAGGAPVEFDVTLDNPTPSAYTDLGNVLFTDRHATVQVRGANGLWHTLPPVRTPGSDAATGFYLQGRDSSAAARSVTTTVVRVSYGARTPAGRSTLSPCVFVNEGRIPFQGTTMCSPGTAVDVRSAPAHPGSGPAGTGATPAPSGVPTASGGPVPSGQLASTGSGPTSVEAGVAGALVVAGGGTVWLAARRRRR